MSLVGIDPTTRLPKSVVLTEEGEIPVSVEDDNSGDTLVEAIQANTLQLVKLRLGMMAAGMCRDVSDADAIRELR